MFRGKPLILVLLAVSPGCAAQASRPPIAICSEAHPRSAGLCANPPKLTQRPDPTYSPEAARAGLEGMVRLRLDVTPEGRPEDIHVVKSLGMGLDEKAVEAVSQWRFEPATIDGQPVAVEISVEVNFRLYDKKQTAKEDHGAVGTGELPERSGGGPSEADHCFRNGIALFRAKDYRAAANAMKRTVELEPSHLYAWGWLCRADYELGRIDEAVAACRKQIAITADDKYAHNNLARALWAQGKLDEAEQEFRRQIAIDPQDRWAHGNLGLLLQKKVNCQAAIPELELGYSLNEKNVKARDALRDCYLQTGQTEKAAPLKSEKADGAVQSRGRVIGGLFQSSGEADKPFPVCNTPGPEGLPCATAPRAIESLDPEYTDQARRAKLQGTVLLDIVIGADGTVTKAQIHKGLGMGLDESSLAAIGKWRFQPGTYEGKPVPVATQVEMTFRLR